MTKSMTNRRRFLQASGMAFAASLAAGTGRAQEQIQAATPAIPVSGAKPNIVMILVDDLGYGDLSCQGAEDLRTPHIDALMAAGMRFDHFYANCPVCSPTRAALLTGCYPDLVGVPGVIRDVKENSWGYLSPKAELITVPLKAAGYDTALVGKWHLGLEEENHPNARGFDHFHGFLGDMMDDYYTHRRRGQNFMRLNDRSIRPEGHATDLFSDWSADYIHDRKNRARPFFLYLPYNAPHTPIQPPEDWFRKVREREPGISQARARLVALIEHMDAGIGRVVEALKASDQYENTLIVFASDNGGQHDVAADNGPLRGAKQDMYEGGIRVPLCAVWPKVIAAGTVSNRVELTMDLFPTFCEAAGAPVPEGIDGRSFLATLQGKAQPDEPRDLFWMRREGRVAYMGNCSWAMRRGPWKLVQNLPVEPYELYNLDQDPLEQNNVIAQEQRIFSQMGSALRAHIQRSGAVPWQKDP